MGTTPRLDHERRQAAFEALGHGLLLLSPQGRVQHANQAAAALFGRRPEQLAGHRLQEAVPGLPAPLETCPFQRLRKSLQRESAEWQWAERWFQVTADPLLDAKGNLAGAVVTLADITQHKLLEEQLRRSQKMEAIGRLAGMLAHDFSNLLTLISGYCQLALEEWPARDRRRRDLEAVLEAVARATVLTRQLLAIGRRQPACPRRLDLNRLIARHERGLRRLLGPRRRLSVKLAHPLGHILADPAQLEQVLMILVVNARDAMPKGGHLTIATSQVARSPADAFCRADPRLDKCVVLSVTDTGTGMDAQTKSHLFEPFFTTKTRRQGIGLGLSILYGIVQQSRGGIEVDSEPGCGTTFRLRFPVAPRAVRPARP